MQVAARSWMQRWSGRRAACGTYPRAPPAGLVCGASIFASAPLSRYKPRPSACCRRSDKKRGAELCRRRLPAVGTAPSGYAPSPQSDHGQQTRAGAGVGPARGGRAPSTRRGVAAGVSGWPRALAIFCSVAWRRSRPLGRRPTAGERVKRGPRSPGGAVQAPAASRGCVAPCTRVAAGAARVHPACAAHTPAARAE